MYVVDLKSGRILYVGQGKAADALARFWKREKKRLTSGILPLISLPLSSLQYTKIARMRCMSSTISMWSTDE
jgi:hypothetical protein